ncbi:MAG: hypothetical protein D8M28_02935 [Proteobacteria bacterium]|nr:hypothetical protein [Pseudomonadota bacterium]
MVVPAYIENGIIYVNFNSIATPDERQMMTVDLFGDGLFEVTVDLPATPPQDKNAPITVQSAGMIMDNSINMNGVSVGKDIHVIDGHIIFTAEDPAMTAEH